MFITFSLSYIILLLSRTEAILWDDNITLYEIIAYNSRERAILNNIYIKQTDISFLNGISNEAAIPMNVVAEDPAVPMFEKKLNDYAMKFNSYDFKLEKPEFDFDHKFNITKQFFPPEQINSWIEQKLKGHLVLSRKLIARTVEKRAIYLLKVSTGTRNCAVFILGGVEARDWISPAVTLNALEHLLESKDLEILTNFYDFYFLPMLNPDGYAYSLTEDRLWSKNRRIVVTKKKCAFGYPAKGVNLDWNWWVTKPSADICDSIYAGPQELSEEETRAAVIELNAMAERLMAFINVRGFGRMITIPFAYKSDPCINHDLMMEILSSVSEVVQEKYGVTYFYGNAASYFYNHSGASADWVKKKLNVPIVYTVSLQYEDKFMPDPSHIEPLTHHFVTILNHSLLIAHEIYGPLFNTPITKSAAIFSGRNFIIFHSAIVFVFTYCIGM